MKPAETNTEPIAGEHGKTTRGARGVALLRRAAAVPLRLWHGSKLVQTLSQDRLLLIATLVLMASAWVPLFCTPFMPLADLPANVAQGALLPDIIFQKGLAGYHYTVQWRPVPYWTTHVFVAVFSQLFGALVAAKLLVGIVVVGVPLATMRLLIALRREPRLALWAFMLSWDHNVYAGWLAYMLGMAFAIWTLAWLLEARTPRQAVRVALATALIGLTHIQPVAYLAVAMPLLILVRKPVKQGLLVHVIGGAGSLICVLPWVMRRMRPDGGQAPPFTFETPPLRDKVNGIFGFTLDNLPAPGDASFASLVFVLFIFGVAVLASLSSERDPKPMDAGAEPLHPAAPVLLLLSPLLLYLVLPMSINGPVSHWYTYPRYATFALLSLLLLPVGRFRGSKVLWLVPGVLAAMVYHAKVAVQFRSFAERAAPFLTIIDHVRYNSAVLPLELDDSDEATRLPPFNQMHSYIAAVKKGYDPHLFDNDSIPFLYRQRRRLPQTAWNDPGGFSLKDHGRHYDYVLIQGARRDPVKKLAPSAGVTPKLVVEAGRFRLYEMLKTPTN
jgi:hypothetical protein